MTRHPTAPDTATRKEDGRLLLGRARFVDDVHLDRMRQGVFIRSPHAHADILSIDPSAALEAGARLVLTARDLPFIERPWIVRYWHPSIRSGMPKFLALDRVRYVGEPVAFLVADDRYQAEDLAALVNVRYGPLPAVSGIEAALADGAPQLHATWPNNVAAHFSLSRGDAAHALNTAARRIKRKFTFPRQTAIPLETRGIVADYDNEEDRLTIWVSTQVHYNVRENLASILDLPEHNVRVVAEDVGGGFGSKSRTYAEEIVVAHASRVLSLPVKWIEDRFEHLQATCHSRAIETELEIGYGDDGRFKALSARIVLDTGAYVFTSGIVTAEVAASHAPGAYKIPNIEIDVTCVGTNRTPAGTYRGAGQPEAAFAIESLIDVIAKDLGVSALDLRRRNIIGPDDLPYLAGTRFGSTDVRFESGDFPAMLDRVTAESGYSENVEVGSDGRRTAWGLAAGIEASGFVNHESARVGIDGAGNVAVRSGMSSQGQGQHTTFAQVCAEALGVDFERVSVSMGDTSLISFGRGAFASRGAVMGANAVLGAAEKLRDRVLDSAGQLLQLDAAALAIREGRIIRAEGGETELTIGDVARAVAPGGPLYAGEPALEETYVFETDQPFTFGLSVHVAQVEVDPRTGFIRLTDYLVVHDAGRALNAVIVEGQIVGGAVEGIGGALLSEIVYDGDGQLLTGTLADYLVVTATEAPRVRLSHMETRPTTNPLGVRGIGEGGTIPAAPAIVNATARAIDPVGIGHEEGLFTLPLKPERVFAACQRGSR